MRMFYVVPQAGDQRTQARCDFLQRKLQRALQEIVTLREEGKGEKDEDGEEVMQEMRQQVSA